MIGTANRQTTITKNRIRDVDVQTVIVRVRLEALESKARAKLALLDADDRRDRDELGKLGAPHSLNDEAARRRDELELARIERAEQCVVLQAKRLERAQRPDSPHTDRIPAIKATLDSLRGQIDGIKSERDERGRVAARRIARIPRLTHRARTPSRLAGLEPQDAPISRWPGIEPHRGQPLQRDQFRPPGRGGPAAPGR
ncbi:hypothetical protein CC117_20805 [Parafrankia colletiae]|uniref:Uncharacterized protein n=1 Tax=Parafrankia colletiae TaxID=573497 RepID=A0A1S1QMI9_9ACTN|nr:hypothetical protein [Parafrankia colletiae]MCK9900627.1 hypothetical protein [Frankia sp. Cpl3]OHV34651.1 hypothetical protein CC117_20805 [Parafrankia colletiae]